MSLDVSRLEKARELANGITQARCPACAENGGDRAGEHLRLYPDGRFGCCVHTKDHEHRRRIFALAGDRSPRAFTVRVAVAPTAAGPAQSVKAFLSSLRGTLGTAKAESVSSNEKSAADYGTFGTVVSLSRAYARGEDENRCDDMHTCKDKSGVVPSVPLSARRPYLAADGTLVIPFDSPDRFHWWKGGQTVVETRAEVELGFMPAERKEQDERTL